MKRSSCCSFLWLWGGSMMMMMYHQRVFASDVCLLLYQMADNNLEYFIRQDLTELTRSPVLQQDATMTTWIYFDHRNYQYSYDDIYDPIENVFNSDGSAVRGDKPEGSQYMRFDHSFKKMVIDRLLVGEQNGDASQTVVDFLTVGLNDCVSKGSTSFFVAFSSHGGGFDGFGGDENTRRQRRNRSLEGAQGNDSIVQAIRTSLNAVPGAPSKIDVIGFDACLMQALGAADEYSDITHYLLASEATEPGHGWAYDVLTDSSSALNLAKNIQGSFLTEKQGNFHDTPKTLAVIESEAYIDFLSSWNALSASMKETIDADDPKFLKKVSRARNQAVSFESILDQAGTKRPAAVDIGSFLGLLKSQCKPTESSELGSLLETTMQKYEDMFVVQGVGTGTKPATGMHVTWPVKTEYLSYPSFYDPYLFDTSRPYATSEAPDWLSFLKAFYDSSSTSTAGGVSVCTTAGGESGQQGLLISPSLSSAAETGLHDIQSTVANEVDWVFIEFGIDLSSCFYRRRMAAATPSSEARLHTTNDRRQKRHDHSLSRGSRHSRRQLQSGDDYLFVYGGDVAGTFGETTYSASWDRQFYILGDSTGESDYAYAFDDGNGERTVPVLYFEPGSSVTAETLSDGFGLSEADFIERYGGQPSYLSFSMLQAENGVVSGGISLYTDDGFTYHEIPLQAGGSISPVLYVNGQISGLEFTTIVGGLNLMLTPWQEDNDIHISLVDTDEVFANENADSVVVVDVVVYDDDATAKAEGDIGIGVDAVFFFIEGDGSIFLYDPAAGVSNDDDAPSDDDNSSWWSAARPTTSSGQCLLFTMAVFGYCITTIGGIFE